MSVVCMDGPWAGRTVEVDNATRWSIGPQGRYNIETHEKNGESYYVAFWEKM